MGKQCVPVMVGVADFKNASTRIEDAIEPLDMMLRATKLALKDTSLSSFELQTLQNNIDTISVVAPWSWNYHDLPGLVGKGVGVEIEEKKKKLSHHGGDSPAKLVDGAARSIARGEARVALVVGGESLGSLASFTATKKMPPWLPPDMLKPVISLTSPLKGPQTAGTIHKVGLPIHVYPLYENVYRSSHHQSLVQNHHESAELYEKFAQIASKNEYAWSYARPTPTAEEIANVGKKNRMICFPYPLLMNAFNNVNLSAACVLTSTEYARELGIREEKWVFPLGGAGTSDCPDFWLRPTYISSPALSLSLSAALNITNLKPDNIDIFDIYSCFPIVPKLACESLGLDLLKEKRPITVLGGLTSFGGAGNNYAMHSITEIARQLRSSKSSGSEKKALVLANGGVLTYQHVLILSSFPPPTKKYPENPLPPTTYTPSNFLQIADAQNLPLETFTISAAVPELVVLSTTPVEGVVETFTVAYARDGMPELGFVVGRVGEGRFVANVVEKLDLKELVGEKHTIGRKGWVWKEYAEEGSRSLFSFEQRGKL